MPSYFYSFSVLTRGSTLAFAVDVLIHWSMRNISGENYFRAVTKPCNWLVVRGKVTKHSLTRSQKEEGGLGHDATG